MERWVVTGSAGHLGEALMRALAGRHDLVGIDRLSSGLTTHVGSIDDRPFVRRALSGASVVVHAATLHKPHVATHPRQAFVDTNVTGTLTMLEEAARAKARAFVFISTTSVFGHALTPANAGEPAVWITEEVAPIPKNVYGATKAAAEDLCQLVAADEALPCVVLRTSRFFPEEDDVPEQRMRFDADNLKANELLYRRVELEDVVRAVVAAAGRAASLRFGKYIISATTPFTPTDLPALAVDAAAVVRRRHPEVSREYARREWTLSPTLDGVYVNAKARRDLAWEPRVDFGAMLRALAEDRDWRSDLALAVGSKGYHRG